MTDDLNRQWAELEGWKWIEPSGDTPVAESYWAHNGVVQTLDYEDLPNWTEPNRFFAEVVPRMGDLGFCYSIKLGGFHKTHPQIEPYYEFIWHHHEANEEQLEEMRQVYSKTIAWAGLTAAIQARKELGK